MSDGRAPIGFATYHGNVCSSLDFETFEGKKGPNYMGELMFPVTAHYDQETNTTRVGFSLLSPEARPEVLRVDKYNITINGTRVRADEHQEARIRAMPDDQLRNFYKTMGGKS